MTHLYHDATRRLALSLLAVLLGLGASGCDLLNVENPNNLVEDQLDNVNTASALVNGARATTARAYGFGLGLYATASDELTWTGSRDAWNQINRGHLADPYNEFADAAFPYFGEARWMTDEAIRRLTTFEDDGVLPDRILLARAYRDGALAHLLIGDLLENFAFSDRQEAAEPLGEGNMYQCYETAIAYLSSALEIARAEGHAALEAEVLALRARAKHGLAVWHLLNEADGAPATPFVAAGTDDAQAFLAMKGTASDDVYQFTYGPNSVANDIADWTNQRAEHTVTGTYTGMVDPVTDATDTRAQALVAQFTGSNEYAPITYVSAREMHLILAEAELASGGADAAKDAASAAEHLNHVRSLGGAAAYDPTSGKVSTAGAMLQHERKANLFMSFRRLHDMYRFGTPDGTWEDGSVAMTRPGSLFPITITEIRANPHLSP